VTFRRAVVPRPRRAARAAAALVLACLTFAVPGPHADADRHYPSAAEVARSKATVGTKAQQVGRIEAQLAAANGRAGQLAVTVAQAVEAYNGARFRLEQAVAAAAEAQRRADKAKSGVALTQRELGVFVAAAYRSGGDLGSLNAILSAQGPRDLISRASALGSIGASRQNAVDRLRSAQALAGVLQSRADHRVTARRDAATQVARAKKNAQSMLAAQRRAVGQISTQRGALIQALAAARHTSVRLERARQQGIESERRAAARRAAAARAAAAQQRAEEAARQARAREKADRQAREKAEHEARDKAERETREKAAAAQSAASSDTARSTDSSSNNSGTSASDGGDGNAGGSTTPPPTGTSEGSRSGAQAAIAFARDQIGKPYVWAADGPSSYDCSGLTMRAWQQGGVSLPHYSAAQYQQSEKVSIGELRPGDLVFYASGSSYTSIYHVGLYVGDGQMIEAPYTGESVRISSIYRSSLFGAARP
jgi:cell wall-associated NlpC family hydrolase